MAVVKAGLIQMSLKGDVESDTPEQISEKMIAAHLPLIEQAAREGRAGARAPGALQPALRGR